MTPTEQRAWRTDMVVRDYREDLDVLRRVQQHNPAAYPDATVARVREHHRAEALRALEALGHNREQAAELLAGKPRPQPPRTVSEFMNAVIRGGGT
jgi:hypothetical protein